MPISDGFSLATRLRSLSDESLLVAIRTRDVRPTGVKDFFDLADALLERQSIQQQLTRLDRGTLAALAAMAELGGAATSSTAADVAALLGTYSTAPPEPVVTTRLATAVELLLADHDGEHFTVYDSVAEQLRSWPAFGFPGLESLAASLPLAALEPVPETDLRFINRLASERAFAATTEVTELLVELEREPARELTKGGIALPDSK